MSTERKTTRVLASIEHSFDRLKHRLTRLRGRGDPVRILPFRGYGNRQRLRLRGRVLEREREGAPGLEASLLENLRNVLQLYESDEVPGAVVEAAFGGRTRRVTADREGYFEIDLDPGGERVPVPEAEISLQLISPAPRPEDEPRATGKVVVPPESARFAVVSDLDDTVLVTGATNLFRHARTVLLNNARSREPLPGIGPFYRALHDAGGNPFAYVSSSPWNLFELFESFLEAHGLPLGPILLKDMGLDTGKLLKTGHGEHKVERVDRLMETWSGLPFLLIGDSGQKDPFIFRDIARRNADRVVGIYIREVAGARNREDLAEIGRELEELGIPFTPVRDSAEAARDAAARGWIDATELPAIVEAVEREKEATGRSSDRLLDGKRRKIALAAVAPAVAVATWVAFRAIQSERGGG